MAARNKPNEFTITRVYDAPVKAVWDAWTDPEQVAQWWGPRGFTLTHHSKDLRAGGHWKYTMHGPDGTDFPNYTVYHEVEPLKRLVYDHGGTETTPPLFRVTVTFEESKGKTTMAMTMSLPNAEALAETLKFIKKANGYSTWDRLAEYLDKESSGKERFVINRTFNAPIHVLFDMWTKPEHSEKWLPPTGATMTYLKADIRPGGHATYRMDAGGLTMYGRADYIEVRKPDLLVYTQHFTDAEGNMSRHPLAPTWPAKMLSTIRFAEEGPNQTRVTVTWDVEGAYTAEELQTFVSSKSGMMGGWTGSFDKLEEYLPSQL
jgi:uncharacterized protein YndB with AHSA1/START domain